MPPEEQAFEGRIRGVTLARVTLSDKGARGEREDRAGPVIEEVLAQKLELGLIRSFLIPDNEDTLKALLVDLALTQQFNMVVTTGGTGLAPTDHTPEATLAVIEKRLPGMEQAMTAASLAKTPHGMLSRAVVGTLAQTLIINLPGSPKAVRENLGSRAARPWPRPGQASGRPHGLRRVECVGMAVECHNYRDLLIQSRFRQ